MVDSLQDPRRVDPGFTDGDRAQLEQWLDYHRATLLLKVEGLDDESLRARPVPTSLMSLHGLVRHMAEVERNWFRRVLAGEALPTGIYWDDDHEEGDFEIPGRLGADEVAATGLEPDTFACDLAVWQAEIDKARAIAADHGLDDTGLRRGNPVSLRWIELHMLEEYARHNGHADLLRELLDGTVGE